MKKIIRILLITCILVLSHIHVKADSPYNTWAVGPGGQLFMTQDAYTPYDEIELDLNGPEDFFVTSDGSIYVADTGNGRIVKLQDFEEVAIYGDGVLEGPTGLYVDEDGVMYIADAKLNSIFILDAEGNEINHFGRPTEPLFGKNRQFLPRKITVDARKNLYIISEGSVNGVVQMNTNGNFIGYFGANTATMSLKMILQRMFLTEEQMSQFIKSEAASPSNITIDNQSMIYTVTYGTSGSESIRKFTVSGRNIFEDIFGSSTFEDVHVSDDGMVLAVDEGGQIGEYDLNGTLLFIFGAPDKGDQRMGTLVNPVAIERYGEFIYVLDHDKNAIVVYQTTEFARLVHKGVRLYMEGFYAEAKPDFEEVLNFNGSYIMSYQAIADAYYKDIDYAKALQYYKYAEDQSGYSEAFWELRNFQLQKYLGGAILWIVGLSLGQTVVKRLERRYRWFDPVRVWLKDLQRFKLVDDFVFMFRFIKQPADSFYYIKKNLRGSVTFALLIYVWVVVIRVLSLYITGYAFNPYRSSVYISPENVIAQTVLAIILWIAANYLISTISDGEGRVRDVVMGTAYSLFPYALFALPIALISNVLTLNESFIYSFSTSLMWFWVGMMLVIMVKEIHNYSFSETVKNILLTLFTIGLFLLTGYILYVLFNQLFEFVSAVLQEIRLRG